MVAAMGCTGVSVSPGSAIAIAGAAAVRSWDSAPRVSQGGIHGGHGFRAAVAMRAAQFEPVLNAGVPRRRSRRRKGPAIRGDVPLRASSSSSDETSGEKGPVKTENAPPSWAEPDSDELPPWAKNERPASQEPAQDVPFPLYLIGSTLVAIAAVGSVFEYSNKNPIFGVVTPDSPVYTPILGFFAITGLPTAGFLFYKSIQLANKASEDADKEDGYRR